MENFLTTSSFLKSKTPLNETSNGGEGENFLLRTGFIRKQKVDKSFSFINVVNEPAGVCDAANSPIKQGRDLVLRI